MGVGDTPVIARVGDTPFSASIPGQSSSWCDGYASSCILVWLLSFSYPQSDVLLSQRIVNLLLFSWIEAGWKCRPKELKRPCSMWAVQRINAQATCHLVRILGVSKTVTRRVAVTPCRFMQSRVDWINWTAAIVQHSRQVISKLISAENYHWQLTIILVLNSPANSSQEMLIWFMNCQRPSSSTSGATATTDVLGDLVT